MDCPMTIVALNILQYLSSPFSLQRFVVRDYKSLSELSGAFQELHMTELYKLILPFLDESTAHRPPH